MKAVAVALVCLLALACIATSEECMGRSTKDSWNGTNFVTATCPTVSHAIDTSGAANGTLVRVAIDSLQGVNVDANDLRVAHEGTGGAQVTEATPVATICFFSDPELDTEMVEVSGMLVEEEEALAYGFYFDYLPASSECLPVASQSGGSAGDDGDICLCSGHGACPEGTDYCECEEDYYGADCSSYCNASDICGGVGRCHMPDGRCQCDDCYTGFYCQNVDKQCLKLLPDVEEDATVYFLSSGWMVLLILSIGILVLIFISVALLGLYKKVKKLTEKKDYIPASVLDMDMDEDMVDW